MSRFRGRPQSKYRLKRAMVLVDSNGERTLLEVGTILFSPADVDPACVHSGRKIELTVRLPKTGEWVLAVIPLDAVEKTPIKERNLADVLAETTDDVDVPYRMSGRWQKTKERVYLMRTAI